jgi:gentisate 1,2-dioxygenase
VRYINPLSGGTAMELIDCFLVQLDAGQTTLPFRTNASSVCCVIEGSGESQVGNDTIRWRKRDIFTLPQGNRIIHKSVGASARLFVVSDRDIYARLGLLKEEYGNIAEQQ